jgi:hypothetical protein
MGRSREHHSLSCGKQATEVLRDRIEELEGRSAIQIIPVGDKGRSLMRGEIAGMPQAPESLAPHTRDPFY